MAKESMQKELIYYSPLVEKKVNGDTTSFISIWESIPRPILYSSVSEDGTQIQYDIYWIILKKEKRCPQAH